MRPGVVVSIIGHVGAVLMTMLAWEARSELASGSGAIVPIEIVDVALESNVRALQEANASDDPLIEEQSTTQEQEAAATQTPSPTQRPSRDVDAFNRLYNADAPPPRPRPTNGEESDRTQEGTGPGTAEVVAIEDRIRTVGRAHLRRCWRMPADLPDPERLRVVVEFDLNRNGTLNGQPRVTSPRNYTFDPYMRAAADAALRAVRQCDPFPFPDDPLVGQHYAYWRQVEMPFTVEGF